MERRWWARWALMGLVAVTVAGCGAIGGLIDSGGESADVTGDPPPVGAGGTAEAPLAIGEAGTVGDWTVAVTEFDLNATEYCLSGDDGNSEPDRGTYALVRVDATYNGTDEGDAYVDLTVYLSDGQDTWSDLDSFGLWPDDLFYADTASPGDRVAGTFCIDVPTTVDVLYIQPTGGSSTVYWDIG